MANINPMQLIQSLRNSGNPSQFVIGMLEQQSGGNPIMANLLNLAKGGKTKDIEQLARNILKEQGKDFDKEFSSFKQMLGL